MFLCCCGTAKTLRLFCSSETNFFKQVLVSSMTASEMDVFLHVNRLTSFRFWTFVFYRSIPRITPFIHARLFRILAPHFMRTTSIWLVIYIYRYPIWYSISGISVISQDYATQNSRNAEKRTRHIIKICLRNLQDLTVEWSISKSCFLYPL